MADPIRIRAKTSDGVTDVHVLMPHPMETGLRTDDSGNLVPAHFISRVELAVAGRTVLTARLSRAVSHDPLLHFRVKGGAPGERITVAWTDNRGETRMDAAVIA